MTISGRFKPTAAVCVCVFGCIDVRLGVRRREVKTVPSRIINHRARVTSPVSARALINVCKTMCGLPELSACLADSALLEALAWHWPTIDQTGHIEASHRALAVIYRVPSTPPLCPHHQCRPVKAPPLGDTTKQRPQAPMPPSSSTRDSTESNQNQFKFFNALTFVF